MKARVHVFSILLILLMCLYRVAAAAVYTAPLTGVSGSYAWGEDRTIDVDFGTSFTSIQSFRIEWSGHINAGWYVFNDMEFGLRSGVSRGAFYAVTDPLDPWVHADTDLLGVATYPDPEFFDMASAFRLFPDHFDGLFDGKTRLSIGISREWMMGVGDYLPETTYATGYLDGATLIVEGTPVPEPSSVAALLLGSASLPGLLYKRQWN